MSDKRYKYKDSEIYVEDTSGKKQDNSENDVRVVFADGDFSDVAKRVSKQDLESKISEAKKLIDAHSKIVEPEKHSKKTKKKIDTNPATLAIINESLEQLQEISTNLGYLKSRIEKGLGL